jgi:capsular polysaccharide biosynthesis protein
MFVIMGAYYSLFIVAPKYRASTTLVLARASDETTLQTSITQTELTLNRQLVATYSELVKSNVVLREVIDNLELKDISEEELRKNVTVTAVRNTELMQIAVIHERSNYAEMLTNEIADVFTEKAHDIYNINNIHVVDKAERPTTPYNISYIKDVIIFAAVGLVIGIVYVVASSLLDNTVKYSEDIEMKLDLTVLSTIPNFSVKNNKKGGKTNG